jgi:hypothetical protein
MFQSHNNADLADVLAGDGTVGTDDANEVTGIH